MAQTEVEALWYLPVNLSSSQTAALSQFRTKLSGLGLLHAGQEQDTTLLRFLKARQWNLEPATTMYSNMVNWRKEYAADSLMSGFRMDLSELQRLSEHYTHFYHKTDKFGRPVYIELLGKCSCTKMLEVASQERIIQYHVWTWERFQQQLLPACSHLAGRPIVAATVVLDMAGLSLKNFTFAAKRLLAAITKIDQDYYPEHLGTCFIINAPYVFTAIWSVVKPLLEERTRKKIQVLGSDYLDTLTSVIPLEDLPTIFGGKSELKDMLHSEGPWTSVEPCASQPWFPQPASGGQQPTQVGQLAASSKAEDLKAGSSGVDGSSCSSSCILAGAESTPSRGPEVEAGSSVAFNGLRPASSMGSAYTTATEDAAASSGQATPTAAAAAAATAKVAQHMEAAVALKRLHLSGAGGASSNSLADGQPGSPAGPLDLPASSNCSLSTVGSAVSRGGSRAALS